MRRNIVAGNWKMNTSLAEGIELAKEIDKAVKAKQISANCEIVLGVPFTHLASIVNALGDSRIKVAAENCADKEKGAYTGEVSAAMIVSTGAKFVIIGHSERRAYYCETSEILKEKVKLALANGLTPIFCIGEVLAEREAGNHFEIVDEQLKESLFDLSPEDFKKIVLAYEPVWAIGTGKTATSGQAQEMHAHIRRTIEKKYGDDIAFYMSILYGGSANADNAYDLFKQSDVDGGLIGGASLGVSKFLPIIDAFDNLKMWL